MGVEMYRSTQVIGSLYATSIRRKTVFSERQNTLLWKREWPWQNFRIPCRKTCPVNCFMAEVICHMCIDIMYLLSTQTKTTSEQPAFKKKTWISYYLIISMVLNALTNIESSWIKTVSRVGVNVLYNGNAIYLVQISFLSENMYNVMIIFKTGKVRRLKTFPD